jgi:hypothetical protein
MISATKRLVIAAAVVGALALSAGPAAAQCRGGAQMNTMRQTPFSLQAQMSGLPMNPLQAQMSSFPANALLAQQYAAQAQLNALQQYALQSQLLALQQQQAALQSQLLGQTAATTGFTNQAAGVQLPSDQPTPTPRRTTRRTPQQQAAARSPRPVPPQNGE